MVVFNNTLDIALQIVCTWEKKDILTQVTIIRDVYGKVSFLMNNMQSVSAGEEADFKLALERDMGGFFSGRIFWKKQSGGLKHSAARVKPIIELIETERKWWKKEGDIEFYISERPIAKKAWIADRSSQESVWPYEEAVSENGTKVVTFYSFKGGMGRTTALAGVVLSLVKQGKNVLMVDTDIEAPGLATLFFEEEAIERGVLDYLIERNLDSAVRIEDYVLDVVDPALLSEEDGHLFLMSAGKVDRHYLQKLARIDYQDNRENYLRDSMATLLKDIRESYRPDYILVDARAGFHDLGGVTVTQLPHGVVLFGNDSRQSWDGTVQVLRTIAERHTADFPVMIVDTMCPKRMAPEFAAARERFIQKSHAICVENYYDADVGIPGIEAVGEAHYPEMVPFNDELLQGIELYSDGSQEGNRKVEAYKESLTGETYSRIADRMESWFGS